MIYLQRTDYLPKATRGIMMLPSGTTLHTIENPWKDNQNGISCVPEGVYPVGQRPFYSGGGYETAHIQEVPGRSLILVHIGNTALDVEGCVAVGLREGAYVPEDANEEHPAVFNSTRAFNNVFWPEVKEIIPTKIKITTAEKADPAALETFDGGVS